MNKTKDLSPYEKVIRSRIIKLINEYCDGSQRRFVEKTGINQGSVSTYVNGKNSPSWENAEKIARAFNIDVSWIMAVDAIPDGISDPEAYSGKENELISLFENADPDVQNAVMILLKSAQHDS